MVQGLLCWGGVRETRSEWGGARTEHVAELEQGEDGQGSGQATHLVIHAMGDDRLLGEG